MLSWWLAPAKEQISVIPKVGELPDQKMSNVLHPETALQLKYVPLAPQPWPCGCQAHLKAGLQIHNEWLLGLMWPLLALSPTHRVPIAHTVGARADPVTTLHYGLPVQGLGTWWHHLIIILPVDVSQRPRGF